MSDLMNLTAIAARDALRGGEISAVDLTEALSRSSRGYLCAKRLYCDNPR